jgi:hypothetical protein
MQTLILIASCVALVLGVAFLALASSLHLPVGLVKDDQGREFGHAPLASFSKSVRAVAGVA